jgi:hypothetical protein
MCILMSSNTVLLQYSLPIPNVFMTHGHDSCLLADVGTEDSGSDLAERFGSHFVNSVTHFRYRDFPVMNEKLSEEG